MLGFLPIDHWNSGAELSLSSEVSIVRRSQNVPDLRIWDCFLTREDLYELGSWPFWIQYKGENPHLDLAIRHTEATNALDRAVLTTQILMPSGSPNVRLLCDPGGMNPVCFRQNRFHEARWARIGLVAHPDLADFSSIFNAVGSALTSGPGRLLNPIRLLEHGLQSSERLVRLLLFTAGLDMILMAMKRDPFVERISRLLGPQTFVFPPSHRTKDQPKYVVEDLAPDIFCVRNEIAHGKIIPSKYLAKTGFLTADGLDALDLGTDDSPCQYLDVLSQGAAFLLSNALGKVLADPSLMREIGNHYCPAISRARSVG
jgi:hypothetical protein